VPAKSTHLHRSVHLAQKRDKVKRNVAQLCEMPNGRLTSP
jgi:hypothetical protein